MPRNGDVIMIADSRSWSIHHSTTTLTSSADPSQKTQSVTYTATVSPQAPSGSVVFKTGTTAITCTATTSYSMGSATCKVKYTATSTGKSIKAVFTSTSNKYLSSTSVVLTQAIDAVPIATAVSTTGSETTTTAVSSNFTSTNGASYVIFAGHTSSSGDSATLTSSGSLKTIHQISAATNSIAPSGAKSGTEPSWQWAWYATGTGTAGTATVTFAKPSSKVSVSPYNMLQVLKLTNVDVYSPVRGVTLTVGKTASHKASVTLSSTSATQQLVYLYTGGDIGSSAPTWSTWTFSNVSGAFARASGATGAGEVTATA